jgi:hypothetical protein
MRSTLLDRKTKLVHNITRLAGDRVGCTRCDSSWDDISLIDRDCVSSKGKTPAHYLRDAAGLFESRNAVYGSNYQHFGETLLALFGGKIPEVRTPEDAQRLDEIISCLGKLQRYAFNFTKGGHVDSADDLMVYAAMLREHTL